MNILIIINDAPYGTEKAYNALRMANQLLKDHPGTEVNIFLLADAVTCGIANQKTPDGYYNIGRMIKLFVVKGGKVKNMRHVYGCKGNDRTAFTGRC